MVDQSPRRFAVAALVLLAVLSDLSISAEAANSVSAFVQNTILSNKIVIFSKSYCPKKFQLSPLSFVPAIERCIACAPNVSSANLRKSHLLLSLIKERMEIKSNMSFFNSLVVVLSRKFL